MYFNYMYTTPSAVCLCDNIGLVSLILLGWELHVLYYVYKASRSCLLCFLCHPYIPHYWGEPERAPPGDSQLLRCLYNWGEPERAPLADSQLLRCLYNNNNNTTVTIPYISKCFYALLFHRHLSTFHGTHSERWIPTAKSSQADHGRVA